MVGATTVVHSCRSSSLMLLRYNCCIVFAVLRLCSMACRPRSWMAFLWILRDCNVVFLVSIVASAVAALSSQHVLVMLMCVSWSCLVAICDMSLSSPCSRRAFLETSRERRFGDHVQRLSRFSACPALSFVPWRFRPVRFGRLAFWSGWYGFRYPDSSVPVLRHVFDMFSVVREVMLWRAVPHVLSHSLDIFGRTGVSVLL